MGINLQKFAEGLNKCRKDLAPTNDQIKDFVMKESSKKVNNLGNTNLLQAMAKMIYSAQTNEEEIVQSLYVLP
jgi:hypothetical protein